MDYNDKIRENDERLTRVEVKVLEGALTKCEKTNKEMRHDSKISALQEMQSTIKGKIGEYGSKITR